MFISPQAGRIVFFRLFTEDVYAGFDLILRTAPLQSDVTKYEFAYRSSYLGYVVLISSSNK